MNKGYIKFWGVRGSHPTPDTNKMGFGGDTSCVEIRSRDNLFILDMGTGIRNLGTQMLGDDSTPKNVHIFLSHYHWDHIVGFLHFKPLFDSSYKFNIYGSNKHTKIDEITKKLLNSSVWPVSLDMLKAKLNFIDLNLDKNSIELDKNSSVHYTNHPHPNGATSYKVIVDDFSVVYTTDCEHPKNNLNKNVVQIAQNADVLIHDSHFTEDDLKEYIGWGHSSWKMASQVARQSEVKKLFLFHFNPEYSDNTVESMEKNARSIFSNTTAAKQNLKIDF